jgi:hypothetical protein
MTRPRSTNRKRQRPFSQAASEKRLRKLSESVVKED